MFYSILIIFFTIIVLLILHELGHFLLAKKFGVKVEEFGVGYPPRIFGKKFGETIYSLNLLPFGAFVKIKGEEEKVEHPRSFSQKPIWQRALIVSGGVVSFWIIGFLILSFVGETWGIPTAVPDKFAANGLKPYVEIVEVSPNSPAKKAGLQIGDIIKKLKIKNKKLKIKNIDKIKEIQELTEKYKGKEITLTIQRGKKISDVSLTPRVSPPKDEGAIGIGLARVVKLKYPWYGAILQGAKITAQKTIEIPVVLGMVFSRALKGEKVEGVKMVGPIGIGKLMSESLKLGPDSFLMFLAMISIWLAFFNILPIPALDGGKLLFLAIEGIRKKPVSQIIEQKITAAFFFALIILMIFVTIEDIIKLF